MSGFNFTQKWIFQTDRPDKAEHIFSDSSREIPAFITAFLKVDIMVMQDPESVPSGKCIAIALKNMLIITFMNCSYRIRDKK